MGKANNIWSFIARNRYFIVIVIGILLNGIIDENSFRKMVLLNMRYNEAKEELARYEEQYSRDSVRLSAFEANQRGVERVARERYFMKRPNEDIFVLSTDDKLEEIYK